MRFLKLRESHGIEARHQFTSLGNDSPGWGDGTQACPGRVFAGNTIKIILAHLITHYDIQLPPGADKPMRHSMPNGSMAPDLWAKIMIREKRAKA
jgi:gliotoxin biosynthesis cytochrome P450 monooxygenase